MYVAERRICFVLMQVDPTLTRADRLVGQVLGEVDALPDVFTELEINFFLLRRLLGVRTQVNSCFHTIIVKLAVCDCVLPCAVNVQGCPWTSSPAHQQVQPVIFSYYKVSMSKPDFGMCPQGGEKQGKVQKLSKGEVLMLNIGSMCTGARVIAVSPPFMWQWLL